MRGFIARQNEEEALFAFFPSFQGTEKDVKTCKVCENGIPLRYFEKDFSEKLEEIIFPVRSCSACGGSGEIGPYDEWKFEENKWIHKSSLNNF